MNYKSIVLIEVYLSYEGILILYSIMRLPNISSKKALDQKILLITVNQFE